MRQKDRYSPTLETEAPYPYKTFVSEYSQTHPDNEIPDPTSSAFYRWRKAKRNETQRKRNELRSKFTIPKNRLNKLLDTVVK